VSYVIINQRTNMNDIKLKLEILICQQVILSVIKIKCRKKGRGCREQDE